MSDDQEVTIATAEVAGRGDIKKIEVRQTYAPRLDGTRDTTAGFDIQIARGVMEALLSFYPGYPWHVLAESRQGFVSFSIPELMGPTLKVFIRMRDLTLVKPSQISELAGNLLERMGLRRGPCDDAEYRMAFLRRHTFDFADVKK